MWGTSSSHGLRDVAFCPSFLMEYIPFLLVKKEKGLQNKLEIESNNNIMNSIR